MKTALCKRLTALALSAVMVLTMVPAAWAEGVVTVEVTPSQLELFEGQSSQPLTAAVQKDGQPLPDAKVDYVSSAPDKVGVDPATGVVEAKVVTPTPVEVYAIYRPEGQPEVRGTCQVTVKEAKPVTGITLSLAGDQIYEPGKTVLVTATVTPTEATDKSLIWNSSRTDVATIRTVGADQAEITMAGPGETIISAQWSKNDKVSSNPVNVEVSGIRMKDTLNLLVGESDVLQAPTFGLAKGKNIEWNSTNISVVEVKDGRVSAYNPGTAEITAKVGRYKATCTVTVKEDTASAVTGSLTVGETFHLSEIISDLKSRAQSQIGVNLEYITGLAVPTNQGILYYGYNSPDAPGSGVGGSERYYLHAPTGQRNLEDVVFVPDSEFGGTAIITYTGQGKGKTFTGTIRLEVENSGDVAYNTAENRLLPLDSATFANTFTKKTGKALNYVTFQLPDESRGTLYYNYSTTGQFSQLVSADTRYYVSGGSLLLDQVSFLPAKNFSGVVTIPYQASDTAGVTYRGKLTITVYEENQQNVGDVTYRVAGGSSVRFDADDFQKVCREATGTSLNYIYLSQPNPGQGRLYYRYNSSREELVSDHTRYFRSSTPKISYIDFVAAPGFTGTVTIPYTGYGSTGERFQGNVSIRVNGNTGSIHYSTSVNRPVDFNGLDFDESCSDSNGAKLDYVTFDLPSSREGTLYYYYNSDSSRHNEVSSSTRYTRSSISNITFVPYRNFKGTVSISYRGYDARGDRYSGVVEITVDGEAWNEEINYTTTSGGVVYFDEEDFNRACRGATGDNLDYVRFDLPSSREGRLYYEYDADRETGSSVSSNTSYYRGGSTRQLDDVAFVAHRDRRDTVYLTYTGRSVGGRSYEGTVRITIQERSTGRITQRTSALPLRFSGEWFRSATAGSLSAPLSYVRFHSLPGSVYGRLTEQFYDPARKAPAAADRNYYYGASSPSIDDLSFVPRAGFQGTVSLSYTAVDTKGRSVEGKLDITVSNQYLPQHFTDLSRHGWATPAIEFLYDYGVVSGYSSTQYGPADYASRGAFVMMVCKVLGFQLGSGSNGFRDVPPDSMFAPAIATAERLGIISGYNGLFRPNAPITREETVVVLERAMRAAGKPTSGAVTSVLDMYGDGARVSEFARNSMASMVRMGLISGDEKGNLNPQKPISRAEIAVILHKLMTQ